MKFSRLFSNEIEQHAVLLLMNRIFLLISSLYLSSSLATGQEIPQEQAPPPEKEIADYVRYIPGATENAPDVLETAVVRFQKGDSIVDLVAVVHLADEGYYENLNSLLAGYDVVLYEMVGGKYEDRAQNTQVQVEEGNPLASVSQLQSMAKKFLGLEFQLDGINYGAGNFEHADVDWEQFESLMGSREQSFSTIMTRAMNLMGEGSVPGMPSGEAASAALLNSLVSAITTGDTAGLKRSIAPFLSEAEALITELEGDDGTVLVTERNKIVMNRIAEKTTGPDAAKKVAVFYGAGHMPDLENRLLEAGYEKKTEAWATAWEITDQPSDPNAPPPSLNFFQELVSENPEVISLMQEFTKAIRDASEKPDAP